MPVINRFLKAVLRLPYSFHELLKTKNITRTNCIDDNKKRLSAKPVFYRKKNRISIGEVIFFGCFEISH
jgi:hypothetical protein